MKKCKSCGALQKDERTTCIDCGERLGMPLSDSELEAAEEVFQDQLEDMSEKTDDFRVTKVDAALIILHALLTIGITVLSFINPTGDEGVGKTLLYVWIGNILTIVELAFPLALWELHTAFLSFRYSNADDLEPGPLWTAGRKIFSIIFLLLDAGILYELIR